jgi:hypothetical protein
MNSFKCSRHQLEYSQSFANEITHFFNEISLRCVSSMTILVESSCHLNDDEQHQRHYKSEQRSINAKFCEFIIWTNVNEYLLNINIIIINFRNYFTKLFATFSSLIKHLLININQTCFFLCLSFLFYFTTMIFDFVLMYLILISLFDINLVEFLNAFSC